MNDEPKRIAIVGAGIIGLYLAWKLKEQGHFVSVFEKRQQQELKILSPKLKIVLKIKLKAVLLSFQRKK